MIFLEENEEDILCECSKCRTLINVAKENCKKVSNGFDIVIPFECSCGYKPNKIRQSLTKLILRFKKNPLQILQWSSANAVIDGRNLIEVPWTENIEYEIEPGQHKVQMSFPYLGGEAGKASIEFEIREEETLLVTYKPPLVVFSPGTILVEQVS